MTYTVTKHGKEYRIPERMMLPIRRYVDEHTPFGDFLTAVFSNDFAEAVVRADSENAFALQAYAMYLYNEVPSACWGSKEKVAAWLKPHA